MLMLCYLFSSLSLPTLVQARPVYIPIYLFAPTFVPHDWFLAQAHPLQPSVWLTSPTISPSAGIGFYTGNSVRTVGFYSYHWTECCPRNPGWGRLLVVVLDNLTCVIFRLDRKFLFSRCLPAHQFLLVLDR